ncbi:MAG: hypothetical protein Q9211_005059 [Gyalolechia sp. 1 TL-2023]
MPQDEDKRPSKSETLPKHSHWPWLATPKPVKRLFDRFPLVTYPSNGLPRRKPVERNRNTLYIFTRPDAQRKDAPSFNPTCLKWQTYLNFLGVNFVTTASNNHASPSGSLPFLLPACSSSSLEVIPPITSSKLQEWASKTRNTSSHGPEDMRYEAYMSLLDRRIRNAWLHTVYLTPQNFDAVALRLYITPETSSYLVHMSLAQTLQSAALEEIIRSSTSPIIDIDSLYRESDKAFSALSELLGANDWFFGADTPGLLDASVFAYTYLLCDNAMGWKEEGERLGKELRGGRWPNLVEHGRRIYERYYQ